MLNSPKLKAVLGPTNTGKTHLAIERMVAYSTGMIGLPLRLLAREVYDRVVERVGDQAVALITGEEKIIPLSPRYWICTTEAMPLDIRVEFLAVDEIQLCADFDRGHVFTNRLLHARGLQETMVMGAATVKGVIKTLLPQTRFEARERLSKLTYGGRKKLTRIPRRSAIVAFSAEKVYAIAELIRRQRGGAAVVMGSLSPRTRNAQVELYQSGEVDHLVATDAIGMGLNMDVDHVFFAATKKFDGFSYRHLSIAEMGQIAGRAGRFMNDGTFGVTADARGFDAETIERMEEHHYDVVKVMQWRNHNLNFASVERLLASLYALPNREGLTRARTAADISALEILKNQADTMELVRSRDDVARLWQTCQIPDYRNISPQDHAGMIAKIFEYVSAGKRKIDPDWFNRQLSFCANTEGDIDTLSMRIAHIRTWTFVANRSDWTDDPVLWQNRTRQIEDSLSDALHEKLTQRFVDRRTSVLMKRLRQREKLMTSVEDDGSVMVEGEKAGTIKGFRFVSELASDKNSKTILAAAQPTIASEIAGRAQSLTAAPDTDLSLSPNGYIIWNKANVARLEAGDQLLKPKVMLMADEQLGDADRAAIQFRLDRFVGRHIGSVLEPLQNLYDDDEMDGLVKGVAFQIIENLGVIERTRINDDIKSMNQEMRGKLRKHGVRFGAFHIFIPTLLKPAPTQLRLLLWALQKEKAGKFDRSDLPEVPGQGLTSAELDNSAPENFFTIAGFGPCGNRVVRIDMLERLADMIRQRVFWRPAKEGDERPEGSVEGGGFTAIPDMMSLVGCSGDEFGEILKSLGFMAEKRPLPVPVKEESGSEKPDAAKADAEEGEASEAETAKAEVEDQKLVADEVADEPQFMEVWWPKDTGPFRAQKKTSRRREQPARHKQGKKPQQKPNQRHRKKPQKIDPDSPFAVLGALKGSLEKRK